MCGVAPAATGPSLRGTGEVESPELMAPVQLLDGPVGTELARRNVATPAPQWSAQVLDNAPELLGRIHADYAEAGAEVHTANTFRTSPWSLRRVPAMADRWQQLTQLAVSP